MATENGNTTHPATTKSLQSLRKIVRELEAIETQKWSEFNGECNNALQHACNDAISSIREFLGRPEIHAVTPEPTKTDKECPSFLLFVDPPGCSWERSSSGLLFGLESMAETISGFDCIYQDEAACRLIQSTLGVFLPLLTERIGAVPESAEQRIREILSENLKTSDAGVRNEQD